MIRPPPGSTRTDTLLPYATLFLSLRNGAESDSPPVRRRPCRSRNDGGDAVPEGWPRPNPHPGRVDRHRPRKRAHLRARYHRENKPVVQQGGGKAEIEADQRGSGFGLDRKRVVEGKSVSVRVDLGGRRLITKKKKK